MAAALVVAVVLGQSAGAQGELFDQMRNLLDQGYHNSAARLNGPDLIARFPDSAEAHYLFARALYLTGDLAGAEENLARAVSLGDANEPGYINLRGLLRTAAGDATGALPLLRDAFRRTLDYHYAMDWGRAAWQAAAYDEALAAFGAAATTPAGAQELWPHINQGRLLMLTGRLNEAIDSFNTAIEVFELNDRGDGRPGSPAYVEAYFRLGEVFEQLGDLGQAETHYRAARSADPNYVPAVTALDRLTRSFE